MIVVPQYTYLALKIHFVRTFVADYTDTYILADTSVHRHINTFIFNPNPGGLVANKTSKTQNCCDKFIIHQKSLKNF